jgi:2,5-diketo-D-gluconate reductase A
MTAPQDIPLADGRTIPQLGIGFWQVPADRAADLVAHAVEVGYRHLDTAAAYRNEAQVGDGIRRAGLGRDELYVTTKCWNADHGKLEAKDACRRSLELLGLDAIDLYLIHWPVPAQDLYVETWEAFVELQQEGLVRSIGVSNFQPEHLDRIVEATGVTPVVNQVECHPHLVQADLRAEHERRGIVTEAWSPLGQGQLLDDPAVTAVAERVDRTPGQVLLRWHLQLGNVVFPKSVTPSRITENFQLFDFELADDDVAAISALDRGRRIGPDPDTFDVR